MSNRQRGAVKQFSPEKGYGFIEPDQGEDVYLSESNAPADNLKEGAKLSFETNETDEGPEAEDVRLITEPWDTALLFDANRDQTQNLAFRVEKAISFDNGGTPDVPKDYSFAQFDPDRLCRRHDTHLNAIAERPGVEVETLTASVDWRLAVGLGQASVYENGITLDATDGIPYVPGSGIKGALRTFLINVLYRSEEDREGDAEDRALQNEEFCRLFGVSADQSAVYDEARQGVVMFHDAYPRPTPTPRVEADVMTPHYQKYYQDGRPPTDDMSPNIIPFLTVTEASFTFAVSTRENGEAGTLTSNGGTSGETPPDHHESRLDLVRYWLRRLLTEHGLGAKTAAGYGFFVPEQER